MHAETLIFYSSPVKVLKEDGDLLTVGGLGIVYDDPSRPRRDLTGEYFTTDTYLGAHKGSGVDVLYSHGYPVSEKLKHLAPYIFSHPTKTEEQDLGLFVQTVLDRRKEYEAVVAELAMKEVLGWSSGSASHLVIKAADGWLKRWPIIEFSLTDIPAEPRTSSLPLKSLWKGNASQSPLQQTVQPTVKMLSLEERMEAIHRAFRQHAPVEAWIVSTFDDHVIVEVYAGGGEGYYRVGYSHTSIDDGNADSIVFAPLSAWEAVEKSTEYTAKSLQQEIAAMNMNLELSLLNQRLKNL